MKRYIVCSIDGVLSNDEDLPISVNVQMLRILSMASRGNDTSIVFLSDKPESVRSKTNHWLTTQSPFFAGKLLMMRKEGDIRPEYIIKKEMAEELDPDNILCVFESRDDVVGMWRNNGIQCYQT